MKHSLHTIAETCAYAVEAVGVIMLAVLSIGLIGLGVIKLARGEARHAVWIQTRQQLGRSILLGLELLVVADIIHTVAVEFTLENVGVLAVIVLIRTFLSFTLEVELTGNWPWQNKESEA